MSSYVVNEIFKGNNKKHQKARTTHVLTYCPQDFLCKGRGNIIEEWQSCLASRLLKAVYKSALILAAI